MNLQAGHILADKYHIEGIIGQGAYGRVYRARNVQLDKVVAIKELRQGEGDVGSTLFADYAERFRREARVQARFNHPNIVLVHDLLEPAPQALYLVMEYVDGGSLKDHLERKGPLPLEKALHLMHDLLQGLEVLHADPLDIIHRDLKPSNILLTRQGQAKLTDFGLAQVSDESLRSMGGKPHPGTPAYMSPEQETTAAYLYPASDIFSAGCILFEMLAGVGYKAARRRQQSLTDLCPDLPDWVQQALESALMRDPEQRVPTAEAFWARLDTPARQAAAQEKAHLEAKEKTHREAAEKAAAEEKARKEAEAEARRKAAQEATARESARKEAEEKARRAAEEQRRKELFIELAPSVTMEFARIPASEFLMGSDKNLDPLAQENETPQHKVYLEEYLIGRYPVTVEQFATFVKATKFKTAAEKQGFAWIWTGSISQEVKGANWQHPKGPYSNLSQKSNHPVVGINWDDAMAFCHWLSQISGRIVRLPSEAEWEKAARGMDGRIYPWGNQEPDGQRANFDMQVKDTTPVGKYSPQGDSPYNCADMAGNAWEWVNDQYDARYYEKSPARNPSGPTSSVYRISRGGSWSSDFTCLRAAYRFWLTPEATNLNFSFRCAMFPRKQYGIT